MSSVSPQWSQFELLSICAYSRSFKLSNEVVCSEGLYRMVGGMIQMYFSIFVESLLPVVLFFIGFLQPLLVLNLLDYFLIDEFCFSFFCYVFVVVSLLYLDNRKVFCCLKSIIGSIKNWKSFEYLWIPIVNNRLQSFSKVED